MLSIPNYAISSYQKNQNQDNQNYLADDLAELPEVEDGTNPQEQGALDEIANLTDSNDPHVQKGLQLIDAYGIPYQYQNASYMPDYQIPSYNTQARVLFWLALQKNIDGDYDRLAVALALSYGLVVTYGNATVRSEIKQYIADIYDYIRSTDISLNENEIGWQAKNYPLEALILLGWGASDLRYPTFFDYEGQEPEENPDDHYWYDEFETRKMNLDDFNWLFVSIESLEEMRTWLISNGFISGDISSTSDSIDTYVEGHLHYYTDKPGVPLSYVEVEDKLTPGCRIANPDWQWNSLNQDGEIIGNCEDILHTDKMLFKSLNIAGGSITESSQNFGHFSVLYYDPIYQNLRTTQNQLAIIEGHAEGEIDYRYYRIGWANLWLRNEQMLISTTSNKYLLDEGISLDYVTSPTFYSISPTQEQFSHGGGTNSVNITSQGEHAWVAVSNANWIHINNSISGIGNGVVNYSVDENVNTSPRTGTMSIACETFIVRQEPAPISSTEAVFRITEEGHVGADGVYYGQDFLTSGADIAEHIKISESVEPGDVVALDPDNPGEYRRSREPYSTLASGVISTQPGFTLGIDRSHWDNQIVNLTPLFEQQFVIENLSLNNLFISSEAYTFTRLEMNLTLEVITQKGISYSQKSSPNLSITSLRKLLSQEHLEHTLTGKPLLTLMGVVSVKATTENGPIEPGDLLTTSSKPGYAMVCKDRKKCAGAIVGKALEPLNKGMGVIKMLVMR